MKNIPPADVEKTCFSSFTVTENRQRVPLTASRHTEETDKRTPGHVFLGESDGVFGHHCFAS